MSAPTPPITVEPTPWRLVLLLGALTAFAPISIDMYLPALPTLQASLGATPGEAQASLATFFAGMAIGQLVYGPASDRFGRRAPIFVGIAIYVAASAACALSTTPEMLIISRFVQALGGCAGGVVARAVVRDRFNHQDTARILSLLTLIMGLAPIFAPFLGGLVLTALGWRAIFWVLAAFGMAVGLWTFAMLRESRSAETEAQARGETVIAALGQLMRQRRLVGYALSGALNGAMLFTYIAASPDLIIQIYGVPAAHFGWVFSINAAGVILASQLNRYVLRRTPADRALARASLTALAGAAFLVLFAFTGFGGAWTVLPTMFVVLASYGFIQGNTMAGALSVDPRRAGSISALMGSVSFGMGAVASTIAGLFHDGTARPLAAAVLIALAGSSLALFSLVFPASKSAR